MAGSRAAIAGATLSLALLLALCVADGIDSVNPFWPHYPVDGGSARRLVVLDGTWDFGFSTTADPLTVTPSQAVYDGTQPVPGAFDVTPPGVEGPKGTAFYRRMLPSISPTSPAAIHFMACSFYCRVFIDGVPLGEHRASGYNPFWIQVPPSATDSPRELVVVVNNEFNSTTAPTHTGGDFYNYGGITRNVVLHELPPTPYHLRRVETLTASLNPVPLLRISVVLGVPAAAVAGGVPIEPTTPSNDVCSALSTPTACAAAANNECTWCTSSAFPPTCYTTAFAAGLAAPVFECVSKGPSPMDSLPASIRVSLQINGERVGGPITVPRGKDGRFTLPDYSFPHTATLWTMASPHLHTVTVSLLQPGTSSSTVVDAIQERFGLRILGSNDDARLTLNGAAPKLHGVNRHTMWPSTGSALTLAQVQSDVALLQKLGANYVRGAHYPQDQRYLDLCDEVGIAMWEETLGPGTTLANMLDPYFMKYQLIAVNEMIDASYNHPSVLLHGFYNEGPNNQAAACPGYNASAATIRARTGSPPTRLVTWANNHLSADKCIAIEDVISFNSYPAWYDHPGDLSYIQQFWQQQVSWVRSNWPTKPFTISETGAGGVYEWTNASDPRWSQGYEQEVVKRDAQFAVGNVNVSGITVWQFNDIKANYHDTALCGQCDYLPHPHNLSVPWTCGYIDVSCGRPGGENHKGQVDFWRRVKASFATLASIFASGAE